jgi:hypothetical protein
MVSLPNTEEITSYLGIKQDISEYKIDTLLLRQSIIVAIRLLTRSV